MQTALIEMMEFQSATNHNASNQKGRGKLITYSHARKATQVSPMTSQTGLVGTRFCRYGLSSDTIKCLLRILCFRIQLWLLAILQPHNHAPKAQTYQCEGRTFILYVVHLRLPTVRRSSTHPSRRSCGKCCARCKWRQRSRCRSSDV